MNDETEISCPAAMGLCLCGKCAGYKTECCFTNHSLNDCPIVECSRFKPKDEPNEN